MNIWICNKGCDHPQNYCVLWLLCDPLLGSCSWVELHKQAPSSLPTPDPQIKLWPGPANRKYRAQLECQELTESNRNSHSWQQLTHRQKIFKTRINTTVCVDVKLQKHFWQWLWKAHLGQKAESCQSGSGGRSDWLSSRPHRATI